MAANSVSISRAFARWSTGLTFADLPAEVVDKVKALILLAVVGGLMGRDVPRVRKILDLVTAEESRSDGAAILGRTMKATRLGAALANCEIMHAAGLLDSYRMLTHPGPVLVSVALTNADVDRRSPQEVITALAAGYEFECRLAHDFVPAIAARGFRPAPLLSTMGAAMVSAKLLNLGEDAVVAAIAVAANAAGGLNEAGRTGGGEVAVHEPNAARQGMFAAMIASLDLFQGSEQVIEGASGFYRAYAGRTGTTISHVFTGSRDIELSTVTERLGAEYKLLDVMFRMYNTAGFNQPVIELMSELRARHAIDPASIDEIVVWMNYLETQYPSPEFPRYLDASTPRPGSTQYFAAYAAVRGSYPVVGQAEPSNLNDDFEVTAMMQRVTLRGVYDYPMFSPSILVRMKDGPAYSGDYPYSRMGGWNYDRLATELHRCAVGIPGGQAKLDEIIATVRHIDERESVTPIFDLVHA